MNFLCLFTLPKTNIVISYISYIVPENRLSKKESSFPKHYFSPAVRLREVYVPKNPDPLPNRNGPG